MSSSYIVEVWNKNGLYAGPGQVFAAHPRKAAITVMRNIGRPQLSAGGTTPYVVHVQDLDSGVEKHYGWSAKHLQGGSPSSLDIMVRQLEQEKQRSFKGKMRGHLVKKETLANFPEDMLKDKPVRKTLAQGTKYKISPLNVVPSWMKIVIDGNNFYIAQQDLDMSQFTKVGKDIYQLKEGGVESGDPSEEAKAAAAAAEAEAEAKATRRRTAAARNIQKVTRRHQERAQAQAQSIIELISDQDTGKLKSEGPDIIITDETYGSSKDAQEMCQRCQELFTGKGVTFQPHDVGEGQYQIKIRRTTGEEEKEEKEEE